uniref:peroxidase (Fragments) n=1 Tax=Glycine max TaxID=3847 RepID=Q9S9H5_SOYBN
LSLQQLSDNFQNKGLTTAEMVALSGGHTIGQAKMGNISPLTGSSGEIR